MPLRKLIINLRSISAPTDKSCTLCSCSLVINPSLFKRAMSLVTPLIVTCNLPKPLAISSAFPIILALNILFNNGLAVFKLFARAPETSTKLLNCTVASLVPVRDSNSFCNSSNPAVSSARAFSVLSKLISNAD